MQVKSDFLPSNSNSYVRFASGKIGFASDMVDFPLRLLVLLFAFIVSILSFLCKHRINKFPWGEASEWADLLKA
jgi:hypothetical protein